MILSPGLCGLHLQGPGLVHKGFTVQNVFTTFFPPSSLLRVQLINSQSTASALRSVAMVVFPSAWTTALQYSKSELEKHFVALSCGR